MVKRTRNSSSRLATHSAELAFAVPQVVAHRLARMAFAGPQLSARDRREFSGMVSEKGTAFAGAWMAMGWQMLRVQQQLSLGLWRACWAPWLARHGGGGLPQQWQAAAQSVMAAGLAPVHRKAVANARRLGRTRLG
ncbi:hypothetical protein CKO44_22135 [Rubrivivax gelatinosus]|uniref:Proline dehydrogenase n=1 Tax=Rubrivivax gelatinosus TaxID=28068 RepID=A0ABS1DTE2_RUBGE|nr:polyhydroxyalkanoate granule-associated phasin [Rubrivivax gelatinosus]MBK1616159.1 hypothetical protein [Rubrivivax gelatinosus]MBK1713289.1 hypothetical protein [Rubrivivax gelatinosus]